MMIRRFAGTDGNLYELLKPSLEIGTRPRKPRYILFAEYFYKDVVGDLDTQMLWKAENNFGRVYENVLKNKPLDGKQGAALVDWISSMLVRTGYIEDVIDNRLYNFPHLNMNSPETLKSISNYARIQQFMLFQDLFSREQWVWKHKKFSRYNQNIVLSDNPVCTSGFLDQNDYCVIVPLSKDVVLFGGKNDVSHKMAMSTSEKINYFLYAWANRSVYASDRETLEQLAKALHWLRSKNYALYEKVSQPYFGYTDNRVRIDELHEDDESSVSIQEFLDSYGPLASE